MDKYIESFRKSCKSILREFEETNEDALYQEYTQYVNQELAKKSKAIKSFEDWRMENDEDYRDEVLDAQQANYFGDTYQDTTDQERFDDKLDMYDIAGING